MRLQSLSRLRPRPAGVIAVVALSVALGGTAAATGYHVLSGAQGAPVYAVYNDSGKSVPPTDNSFHTLATDTIPAAGNYWAVGKVRVFDSSSTPGRALCTLTARSGSGPPDFDTSVASVDDASGTNGHANQATIPLEVVHHFSGRGTIKLACQQNGTSGGGATLNYSYIKIIATKASSLSNRAVTH
jgi:hypothetical protein